MTHFFHSVWNEKKMTFFELCVSSVLTQNEDIWNFHGSLTLHNGKLIWYSRSLWYAIVSNMTHFFHSVWNEKKMTFFELCFSSVLTQNEDIWNFHGSLTLNNGKLIWYSGSLWYAIVSNVLIFTIMLYFLGYR